MNNMESLRDILGRISDRGVAIDLKDHSLDSNTDGARFWLEAFEAATALSRFLRALEAVPSFSSHLPLIVFVHPFGLWNNGFNRYQRACRMERHLYVREFHFSRLFAGAHN